jgi:predicted nuclease of predicted toxin-antitoxin system
MNLAPVWVRFLQEQGFEAVHWSTVRDPSATDATIMEWARRGGYVVLTHDLDFSALLAVAEATGPSVKKRSGSASTRAPTSTPTSCS